MVLITLVQVLSFCPQYTTGGKTWLLNFSFMGGFRGQTWLQLFSYSDFCHLFSFFLFLLIEVAKPNFFFAQRLHRTYYDIKWNALTTSKSVAMTTRTEFNFLIKNWFWLSFMQVMKTIFIWGCLVALFIEPCISDMYMHAPAGSNNRLNGNQDNVRNANRLFDSQVDYHYKLNFYCGNLIEGHSHKIFCYPLPSP